MNKKTAISIKWVLWCLVWTFGMMCIYTAGYYEGSQEQYYTTISSPFHNVIIIDEPIPCPLEAFNKPNLSESLKYNNQPQTDIEIKKCDTFSTPIPRIMWGRWTPLVTFLLIMIGLIMLDYSGKKASKYRQKLKRKK